MACSTEEAIRANAETYYQLALDIQLHVDEHTPCNKSTCITDIVLEYLAYKKTGKVKRGFTEFTLSETPPPPCKRPIRARDVASYVFFKPFANGLNTIEKSSSIRMHFSKNTSSITMQHHTCYLD